MLLAKEALMEPIDIHELQARGPSDPIGPKTAPGALR